jgi:hypothetical protein
VDETAVSAHGQEFDPQRLEFPVLCGDRRQFGWSDEGEVTRIEAKDNPLAFVV